MADEFQLGQDVGGALRDLFTFPSRMRAQSEQEQLAQALFAKLLRQQGIGADAEQGPQLPPGAVPPGGVVSEGGSVAAQLLSGAGPKSMSEGAPLTGPTGPTLGYEPPPAPPSPTPDLSRAGRRMDPGALLQMLQAGSQQQGIADRAAQQRELQDRLWQNRSQYQETQAKNARELATQKAKAGMELQRLRNVNNPTALKRELLDAFVKHAQGIRTKYDALLDDPAERLKLQQEVQQQAQPEAAPPGAAQAGQSPGGDGWPE